MRTPDPDFAALVEQRRAGRSYRTLSEDAGGRPSTARFCQMTKLKAGGVFPQPESIAGAAKALGVGHDEVVLCLARQLGLDVDTPLRRFVAGLPPGVERLTGQQLAVLAGVAEMLVESARSRETLREMQAAVDAVRRTLTETRPGGRPSGGETPPLFVEPCTPRTVDTESQGS